MSETFKPSRALLRALMNVQVEMDRAAVPDPGVAAGYAGLSRDSRRLLHAWSHVEAMRKRHAERQAPALPKAGVGDAVPFRPTLDFSAPPAAPVAGEGTAPAPTAPVAEGAAEPVVPPRAEPVDVPATIAKPSPTAQAPQPGGVPAVQAGTETNAGLQPMKKSIVLKNAKAGEAYDAPLDVDGLKSPRLEDGGGSGLSFDEAGFRVSGTPRQSGDFRLQFRGLIGGRPVEVVANLAVIPDPKSLWVSKPSDPQAPFWKPDEASLSETGSLFCIAASKRGRSHARDGGFRDDDFGLRVAGPDGWHIAVVADGAGSAEFSRRGSQVAVAAVLERLPALLDDYVTPDLDKLIAAAVSKTAEADVQVKSRLYQSLATAAFEAAKAIEAEAAAHGSRPACFSTTLVLCVARRVADDWFIAGFSVGDGGAGVFDCEDRSLETLSVPDSGDFAGQTRFLHRSEFADGFDAVSKRLFYTVRKRFTAILVMTDGITDPKFPTDALFADARQWTTFWRDDLTRRVDLSAEAVDVERQLLEWLDFWSPGNHDDRTIAVLVPRGEQS